MRKIDLIKAIDNLPDDATILFGNDKEWFFGNFADTIIYDEYDNKILVTNKVCDLKPKDGKVIFEDEIEQD